MGKVVGRGCLRPAPGCVKTASKTSKQKSWARNLKNGGTILPFFKRCERELVSYVVFGTLVHIRLKRYLCLWPKLMPPDSILVSSFD